MRRWIIPGGVALFALALGCHHEVEMVPLAERTIYVTDRFYDVQALTKDRAFVVGYGGKILETANGGGRGGARARGPQPGACAQRRPPAPPRPPLLPDRPSLHPPPLGADPQQHTTDTLY